MANIIVRLMASLARDSEQAPPGPVFHRWLPNGEVDAVRLAPERPPSETARPAALRVWFERRALAYASAPDERREQEPPQEVVDRQGVLWGGTLFAELTLDNVSAAEVDALTNDQTESEDYKTLTRIVYRATYKPLRAFVALLRVRYGQLWLQFPEVHSWRQDIPTRFVYELQAHWRPAEAKDWRRFGPRTAVLVSRAVIASPTQMRKYLTHSDWQEIQANTNIADYDPPVSAEALGRSALLLESGDVKSAAVEAVSGLEMAIDAFIESNKPSDPLLAAALDGLRPNPPLDALLGCVSPYCPAGPQDKAATLRGIKIRNRMVHEGWTPRGKEFDEVSRDVRSVIRTAAALIGNVRVLESPRGFAAMSPAQWEESYEKR